MRAGSQTWTTILTRLRTKAVDAGYSGRIRPPPVVGPALPPRPGPVTGRTHAPEVPQAPHSRRPDGKDPDTARPEDDESASSRSSDDDANARMSLRRGPSWMFRRARA